MNILSSSGSRYAGKSTRYQRNVSLKDIKAKYVYVGYQDSSIMDSERTNYTLRSSFDLVPCKLSKADIKVIKDNPNFIHLDAFMEQFKPTDSMINALASDLVGSSDYYDQRRDRRLLEEKTEFVCENITRLQDKVLTTMAQRVKLLKEGVELDRHFRTLVKEKYQTKIHNRARIMQMFLDRLDRKYPLARLMTKRSELLTYINEKAR